MKVNTNLKLSFAISSGSFAYKSFLFMTTDVLVKNKEVVTLMCSESRSTGEKDYCTTAKIACLSPSCRSSFYHGLSYGRRKSASLSSRLRNC